MHRRKFWLVGVMLLASLSLVASGSAGQAAKKPRKGGQVVFGAEQEPGALNTWIVGGDHLWAAAAHYVTMAGNFDIAPNLTYKPEVISKYTVKKNPLRVTYYIRKNARWSDGRPITVDDYRFTWQTVMNKSFNIISTIGFEDIRSITAVRGNKKVVLVTYKKPYADYRDTFGILPRHALQGENFNNVWRNDIDNPKTGRPIGSGPFLLQSWQKGNQMVFVPNTRYWGKGPYLNRLVYKFVPDTNTQAQQVRGGELDVINPQPQLYLAPLRRVRTLAVQSKLGLGHEHLDFNLGFGQGGNPALKKLFVRRAIAHGTNRQAIVNALYQQIVGKLPVFNHLMIFKGSKYYTEPFKQYNFSAAKARDILTKAGCRRGGDGIFTCQGDKLSFRFSSTAGNQLRELTFEIMQRQLKNAGIELVSRFNTAAVVFRQWKVQGNYDILMYAWSFSSPGLAGFDSLYGCRTATEAQQNDMGYCNRRVDAILKRANAEFNEAAQAKLINQATALIAKDLPTFPLFQKPRFLVYKKAIKGVSDTPVSQGPLWNTENWHRFTVG